MNFSSIIDKGSDRVNIRGGYIVRPASKFNLALLGKICHEKNLPPINGINEKKPGPPKNLPQGRKF